MPENNEVERDPAGWIRYGQGPGQIMHPATVARLLATWWERDKLGMGALIAETLTGTKYRKPRES